MTTTEQEETLEELLGAVESTDLPLDSLVEEILTLTEPPSPPSAPPTLPTLPREDLSVTRRFSNIYLTAAIAAALVVGCGVGFFLAKPNRIQPEEGIALQISSLIDELQKLYDNVPQEEIIEPLAEPAELQRLAPSEMT